MKLKKILAFSIGPIGGSALGFFTLPIVTWFYSAEDIGRISMLQTVIGFCALFFTLGLDQLYVRNYHDTGDKKKLFYNCFLPCLYVFSFFLITISILPFMSISELLFERKDVFLSFLIILTIFFALCIRYFALILRMQENAYLYSLSQLLPRLIYLITVFFYVCFTHEKSFYQLILSTVLSLFIVFIFLFYQLRRSLFAIFHSKLDIPKVKQYLTFGLPLIPASISFWGLTSIDRFFLQSMSSFEELGVYSVSVSFAASATVFQAIFSVIWGPTVYRWVSEGKGIDGISNVVEKVTIIVIVLFCLTGIFSWLTDYILPEQYAAVKYIVVSCVAFPLLYTLSEATGIGISIKKKTVFIMLISVTALIFNLIGNYYLIPDFGAKGASVSTAISFWIFFVLRSEFSSYFWVSQPRFKMHLFVFLATSLSVIFTLYGSDFSHYFALCWCTLLVTSLLLYKSVLFSFIFYFKKK